ncbi:MAG: hypothetical protein IPN71_05825 [Fibrobacteres bacterium]|jgi:hypothetical protein|nr:hypothetical protein [Fibrobacterota bacterium]
MAASKQLLMIAAILASTGGAQDVWTPRAPEPSSQPVNSIACSPARCVASSDDGSLLETTDGKRWSHLQGVPKGMYWHSISWSGGRFLAVGLYGWGISADGSSWEFQELNMSRQSWTLTGGGWTGREFLLMGSRDSSFTSSDGRSWIATQFQCTQATGNSARMAQGSGKLVIGFRGGSGCVSSDSGKTWADMTNAEGSFGGFHAVGFDGSQFTAMAQDQIWTSSDGIQWTATLNGQSVFPRAFYADTSRSIALGVSGTTGFNAVWGKPKGGSWDSLDTVDRAIAVREIGRASWGYVALGEAGHSLFSTDGIHWEGSASPGDLRSVVHAFGAFHAVGLSGRLIRSSDGEAWTKVALGSRVDLLDIATDGKRLVVVADSGKVWVSTDGLSWTLAASGVSKTLRSVAWNGNRFTAVGDLGTMIESTDGSVWSGSGFSETVGLVRVVAAADTLYVLDSDGWIWVRSQGKWAKSGLTTKVVALGAHSPNGLVALEGNGGIWSSADGLSWKRPSMWGNPYASFYHTGKEWLAIGSTVASSVDGMDWTDRAGNLFGALSAASDGTTLVAVGVGGRIWTSPLRAQVSLRGGAIGRGQLGLRALADKLSILPVSDAVLELSIRDMSGRIVLSRAIEAKSGQEMTVPAPAGGRFLVATVRQGSTVRSVGMLPSDR